MAEFSGKVNHQQARVACQVGDYATITGSETGFGSLEGQTGGGLFDFEQGQTGGCQMGWQERQQPADECQAVRSAIQSEGRFM
jgi:hypothetical protein